MFTRINIVFALLAGILIDSSVYLLRDDKNSGAVSLILGLICFYKALTTQNEKLD
jgi:hypothetical protein